MFKVTLLFIIGSLVQKTVDHALECTITSSCSDALCFITITRHKLQLI